jgi:hypothetical protein
VLRSPVSRSVLDEGFGAGAPGLAAYALFPVQVDLKVIHALAPAEDGKI